MLAFLHCRAG